ncbi:BamA/TamA family outer membrane protein, partial [bacterium]|nr:BamA/TamA family outer membrane protein [bacterium]
MTTSKSLSKVFFLIFYLGLYLLNISLYAQQNPESPYGRIIKEIRIKGLKHTKKYIVKRELLSKVGNPLLKENLSKEYKRLDLLDIFSSINIQLSIDEDGIILTYSFAETPPFIPSPSLSITEENGISAGGSLLSPNLLGRDIFMSARVLFGEAKTGEFWLINPWISGNHLGYKLENYYRDRTSLIEDFQEKANEFYLRIGSHLGENGRFGGIFESLNIQSDTAGVTLSADNIDTTSRIGFYLGYDNRDAISDTRQGW